MPFKAAKKRNVGALTLVALACGLISIVLAYFVSAGGIALGAVGLLVGGYSINAVRIVKPANEKLLVIASGAGLLLAMVGFILGFAYL